MKERGIIFSAPMVRALLDGRKSQTRRVVKFRWPYVGMDWDGVYQHPGGGYIFTDKRLVGAVEAQIARLAQGRDGKRCPYGQPGDLLWVRETWQRDVPGCPGGLSYRADHRDPRGDGPANPMKWRSPLHMPRTASRITLELTGVRVERLHDISDADAEAEGLDNSSGHAADAFGLLWESIHGEGSWDANPWLWVLSFRRVTP